MNRLQTLESDIKRNASRLGGKGRPTPTARRRDAAPAPAPVAAAPPAPAVGDHAAPAPADQPAAASLSVAAAMSAWQGTRGPSRARSMSARSGRPRSRAFAVPLDYRVPDLPMPIQQTSNLVCWAFVATMMASWRDRVSHTVEEYIGGLGEPWITKLHNNNWLLPNEAPQFLATMGIQIETTQANFTNERWEAMLRDWGPIWVTADNNKAPGMQGVHALILVGIHGPSDGDPTVDVIDPALGREVQMSMTDFRSRYEQLANTPFAGLQVRHWPARAQHAAAQSLAWAQQEIARRSRAMDGGLGAAVAAAGLLYQVYKDVTTTNGLTWTRSELKGKTVPGNIEAKKGLADQGNYVAKRLKSLRRLTWDEIAWDDNVGAEFEISYEYNGSCVANVRLTNISYAPPRPLSGRNLSVDTKITQAYSEERGDIAAVEVEIVYQFSYVRGSAGTFTQRYVLYGDGRQEKFTETRS